MKIRGQLLRYQPLADYTSWRVGGPADQLYLSADSEDLLDFLQQLPANQKLTWLGLGSNTLVRDGGIRGTVIVTQGCLNQIAVLQADLIRAEAGVACPAFARFCARQGLQGTEFLAGIPGTIGGALAMNAGCHGGETWRYVIQVETVDRSGKKRIRPITDYQVAYRSVNQYPDEWFLAAYFHLPKGDKQQSLEKIRDLLVYRAATQPTNEPSCGSVFRNPPGDYAGRLIEACGLKSRQIGGAHVSAKHANFIVNDGTATAQDIESLIEQVSAEVQRQQAVVLTREVHIIGETVASS